MARLQIYKPFRVTNIGQPFGANNACVNSANDVVTKTNGVCPAGYQDLYKSFGLLGHSGIDIGAPHGRSLYHWGPPGTVEEIQTELARGLGIGIVSSERFDMGSYGTHYVKCRSWHLMGFNVKIGDTVNTGDLIGWTDNTGYSSGDHLHAEVKPVEWNGATLYNVFQTNGYNGAIDHRPYWGQYAAEDVKLVISILTTIRNLLQKVVNLFTSNTTK